VLAKRDRALADPGWGKSGHGSTIQFGYRLWSLLKGRNKRENIKLAPPCRMSGSVTPLAECLYTQCDRIHVGLYIA